MSTPDQVKFSTNPVEGTSAESELVIFRSELPSYNPDSNKFVRINLPVADKAWIDWGDTTLSLKLTNRSADTSSASASNASVRTQLSNLIRSVSILNSQGEQIEYVNNYNLISNIMDDYSMGTDHKASVEQILAGGSPDGDPANAVLIAGSATTSQADSGVITLTDRLMTGFTSGQYLLPLGYLVGQACAIVLELEDPNTALAVAHAGNKSMSYKVENVELRAKQIRFNAVFNQSFERTLAEAGNVGINYITESFIHNQNSIPAASVSTVNIPFSCNPRSAKYILACHRIETDVTNSVKYSLGIRSGSQIQDYKFEIQGKQYPSQPIKVADDNVSQAFSQVLDCLGQIGALNHSTLISRGDTNTLFFQRASATACKFVAGLPLEDFNSATNPSVYSGMNLTTAGQLSYQPNFAATVGSTAIRVDFFTSCDMSIHFTLDGRMYSVR